MELSMRFALTFVFFFQSCLIASDVDFDVAVVGTSPISMLEAIYHIQRNERVLILEEDERCGGAWKSIDICGIAHADLGCHLLGSDHRLREFLEHYFGCRFICLEHVTEEPVGEHARCSNGFYFSKGCNELIGKLKQVIDFSANAQLVHQKLDSIFVDREQEHIELALGCLRYTTSKLIVTPFTHFHVLNPEFIYQEPSKRSYDHLYILVEDPAPSRFTYLNGIVQGMSRAMNLTPFLDMPGQGLQFIVIQTNGKEESNAGEMFLDAFKNKGFLSADAKIITFDTYTYHQLHSNPSAILRIGGGLIESLDTSGFTSMLQYLEKWKAGMIPI
jgi:hypothetical protein